MKKVTYKEILKHYAKMFKRCGFNIEVYSCIAADLNMEYEADELGLLDTFFFYIKIEDYIYGWEVAELPIDEVIEDQDNPYIVKYKTTEEFAEAFDFYPEDSDGKLTDENGEFLLLITPDEI